ncbi:MAG: DAK2 domain-containing protein, partial [Oscillospiraceae bacterium]|nr:DAK2 domain-containing protein [Oscillospiraceae bacterium]
MEADGKDFALALANGVEAAYKAVMKPAEGTILTVSRLTAVEAEKLAEEDPSAEYVLTNCIKAAKIALDNTINQNPVLKKAGVVDAGGMGFLVILEAMLSSLQGNDVVVPEGGMSEANEQANFSDFDDEDITFTYCTECIVSRENDKDPELFREFLSNLGDSLVLVADDEIIKVHVHTDHPGLVYEEALTYGSFLTTKVENMRLQHTEKVVSEDEKKQRSAKPEKKYGCVAVCAGEGLAGIFRDLGVDVVVEGGQTMNPSTEDILAAIDRTPSEIVFVLPNNKNIIMAAQQAAELAEKQVVVIGTKTVPQGITAMLSFDESMECEENAEAMTSGLDAVTTMQITYAARDSDFDGYDIHEGDYLGLCNSSLLGTSRELDEILVKMAQKVNEDGQEIVSIFYGCDITEEQAEHAASLFCEYAPDAEVTVLNGGQPIYYYLISAE